MSLAAAADIFLDESIIHHSPPAMAASDAELARFRPSRSITELC